MANGYFSLTTESVKTSEGINKLNQMLRVLFNNIAGDTDTVRIYSGYASPESLITAGIGALYLRVDGGSNTTLYVKESGTGNTGWVAK